MKFITGMAGSMFLILVSCSPYQKVCSSNLAAYNIPDEEVENLRYVLKKKDLHYTSATGSNTYNWYDTRDGSLSDSRSALMENNLVIPKGARGSCRSASKDSLFIDFGEGVGIAFRIHSYDNSPANQVVVDQRNYRLKVKNRTGILYFDVTAYSRSRK
jgi:hypothetical protein